MHQGFSITTRCLSAAVFLGGPLINFPIINTERLLECLEKHAAYKNSISCWIREQWDSWVLLLPGQSYGDLGQGYFPSSIQSKNATTTLDALRLKITSIWSFLRNPTKHTFGQWKRVIHYKNNMLKKKKLFNQLGDQEIDSVCTVSVVLNFLSCILMGYQAVTVVATLASCGGNMHHGVIKKKKSGGGVGGRHCLSNCATASWSKR